MGGHGGLNILPQKRWNVYNFDNREKVRKDEEAAAKEEQLKREQSHKRDSELRLEKLRTARNIIHHDAAAEADNETSEPKSEVKHMNLFEGIRIFDPVDVEEERRKRKKIMKKIDPQFKERKPEEDVPRLPEDEKYRLGYGIAGKGVKLPWYLSRPTNDGNSGKNSDNSDDDYDNGANGAKAGTKSSGKKTIERLREERLKREKNEKERERALIMEKQRKDRAKFKDSRSSRR